MDYDAILFLSFGGPEGPDDVIPFLENVLRGRNVPRERMLEVAQHYQRFGGVSPINQQNRELIAAIEQELAEHGPPLPVYWGNRNWHPLLVDTMRQMRDDGVRQALAFFTSAFSSYSGCRQYRENILAAQEAIGEGAPQVDKLRMFFNHPGFIETMVDRTEALDQIPDDGRTAARLIFTAHSIPMGMSDSCNYVRQLEECCGLIARELPQPAWDLVYQSRSGPPHQPWLEPDVCDHLKQLKEQGIQNAVIVPIGFISDHMEVIYDLDHEAHELAQELNMNVVRARTAGTHPRFVRMIRELITERVSGSADRPALGQLGPSHDICPVDCCLSGRPANRT